MRFLSSEEAVSEVVGYIIVLGLAVTGVAVLTAAGMPSIFKLQDMSNVRNAEQSLTVLDSRANGAILGSSPTQVIDMNLDGGILAVEPNSTDSMSYMLLKSSNNSFNIAIPMGKLRYSLGDRTVGYEGGGVWSKYPSGGSVMLSPPEFYYDGRTLTLPVITINGNANMAGKGKTGVTFKKNSTMVLFPNTTMDKNRTNPLNYSVNGKVYVNITSDFYDAWADYAKNLIYTTVNTDSANRTTSIELTVVPNTLGTRTAIASPISLRGIPSDNTPLDNFSLRIYGDFNNFKWDIRAKNGNRALIFFIFKSALTIGYQDTNLGTGETWGTYTYPVQTDAKGDYIDVDLLSKNINLTYSDQNVGADNANKCQPYGGNIDGIANPGYSWDGITLTPGTAQTLYNITQHYIWRMGQTGEVRFSQCSPAYPMQDNHDPNPQSTMIIGYNATGTVDFLHVTDNTADLSIV